MRARASYCFLERIFMALWKSSHGKLTSQALGRLPVVEDPPGRGASMIETVPLHLDIMKAWEEYGDKGE